MVSYDDKEKINFIYYTSNSAAIANNTIWLVNLENVRRDYGYTYNALVIKNLHNADGVFLQFDGNSNKRIPLTKNGGTFSLSQEDMIKYTQIEIVNSSGSEIAIGYINISIIRAGVN